MQMVEYSTYLCSQQNILYPKDPSPSDHQALPSPCPPPYPGSHPTRPANPPCQSPHPAHHPTLPATTLPATPPCLPAFPDSLACLVSHDGVACSPRPPATAVCVGCKSTCNPSNILCTHLTFYLPHLMFYIPPPILYVNLACFRTRRRPRVVDNRLSG